MRETRDGRLNHRLYVLSVMLLAALIVVFLNMASDLLENKYDLYADFSRSSVFTLSEETRALLDGLSQDVLLYAVYENDARDVTVEQLLKAYDRYSARVRSQVVDPIDDVAELIDFARDATAIGSGSIVVSNAAKDSFIVLDYYDFYLVGANGITGVQGEQSITSAIAHLDANSPRRAIFMNAHTDSTIESVPAFATHLSASGYDLFQTTDVFSELFASTLDERNDVLVFLSPNGDLQAEEADALIDYVERGGSIVALVDYSKSIDDGQGISLNYSHFDNFSRLFNTAGMRLNQDLVLMPPSAAALGSITRLICVNVQNEWLTGGDGATGVIMSECASIDIDDSSAAQPLLMSPAQAYSKRIEAGMTLEKTDEDEARARCVAACGSIGEGRVALLGSSSVAGSYFVNEANRRFLLKLTNMMVDDGDNPIVMPVSTVSGGLKINSFTQQAMLITLLAGVIPLSVLAFGAVVLYRRKKRSGRAKCD